MKKLIIRVLLVVISNNVMAQGIEFDQTSSWKEVKAKAKAENKLIFVDCFATWCGPCKLMEQTVYDLDSVGKSMNANFISVKLQFDHTANDNDYVKSWYGVANQFNNAYKVNAYPTLLFFSANGDLIYSDLGFKGSKAFMEVAGTALHFKEKYGDLLNNYQKGIKDYPKLPDLIFALKDGVRNGTLATSMANDYIKNYLNQKNDSVIFKTRPLQVLRVYANLTNINEKALSTVYNNPEATDKVMDKGWTAGFFDDVIQTQELRLKLEKNNKPVFSKPDWQTTEKQLSVKYPKTDIHPVIENYQIDYYWSIDPDYKKWAAIQDKRITQFNPTDNGSFFRINIPAWNAFLKVTDPEILQMALKWSEKAAAFSSDPEQETDTKASLLYKLGRRDEAIKTETQALEIATRQAIKANQDPEKSDDVIGFKKIIAEMKAGKPIYLDQGAVWSTSSKNN